MHSAVKTSPKRAVAYLRVSTAAQDLGPEAQRAAILAWAGTASIEIVAWNEDRGIGGGSDVEDRPGLVAALAHLREHRAGVLVVAKRDRLARDVAIAVAIERAVAKHGARVVSADGTGNGDGDTASDEFMRIVIDGAAAYERALIRQRTKAALQAKRAQGLRAGAVPFGFEADDTGRLNPCPHEQRAMEDVRLLRARGYSMRAIVRECGQRGHVSRAGNPLGLTQVTRILERDDASKGAA